jgi:hypothetical protein
MEVSDAQKVKMRAYYLANKAKWKTPEQKEKNRLYRLSHRQERLEQGRKRRFNARELVSLIKSVPCADCNIQYPVCVMDLDHVRGVKFKNVSTMIDNTAGLKSIMAEVDKCEVVCSNCHRIRTAARKAGAAKGGPNYHGK